jgi:hypothetical protein
VIHVVQDGRRSTLTWSIGASFALFPPSSRPAGLSVLAASAAIRFPATALPLNMTSTGPLWPRSNCEQADS